MLHIEWEDPPRSPLLSDGARGFLSVLLVAELAATIVSAPMACLAWIGGDTMAALWIFGMGWGSGGIVGCMAGCIAGCRPKG